MHSEISVRFRGNNSSQSDELFSDFRFSAYELWFKQILVELDSIKPLFDGNEVEEANMLLITQRLNRIVLILKVTSG